MSDLPNYDDKQLNTLRVLAKHGESISQAWLNYSKTVEQLIALHDEYYNDPSVKSMRLAYQVALLKLELAKTVIQEHRDLSHELKISEWLP